MISAATWFIAADIHAVPAARTFRTYVIDETARKIQTDASSDPFTSDHVRRVGSRNL